MASAFNPTPALLGSPENAAMQHATQQNTGGSHSPRTFTSTQTTEAVQAYRVCMILAAELRPYALPQDMTGCCLDKLAEVRQAATAEHSDSAGSERAQAIDAFVTDTQARVIHQVLTDEPTTTP